VAKVPSAAPTATGLAATPLLPARLGLPAVHALPDGVWDAAGPGWVLGVYRSLRASDTPLTVIPETTPGLVNSLVLASPDGVLYQVRDLTDTVDVAFWRAGTTTAILVDGRSMDLATGDIASVPNGLDSPSFLGMARDGRPMWSTANGLALGKPAVAVAPGASAPVVSPDARLVALASASAQAEHTGFADEFVRYDIAAGTTQTVPFGVDGDVCEVVAWTDATSLLALCVAADFWPTVLGNGWTSVPGAQALAKPAYYVVDVTGSTPSRLAEHVDVGRQALPSLSVAVPLGAGAVAFVGTTDWPSLDTCPTGVYRWQDGTTTPLVVGDGSTSFGIHATGNTLWIDQQGYGFCPGGQTAAVLSALAPDGSSRVVFPSPTGELSGGDRWVQGLTSWAVAE
jgi:hypothetical protein